MAIRYQSAGEAHREGPDSCPSLGQDLGWGRASPERKGALRAPQSGPRSPGSRVPELLAARSRIPSTGRCRKPPDTHSTMQTSDIRAQARRTARAPTPARLSGRIWDGGAPRRSERAQGRKGAIRAQDLALAGPQGASPRSPCVARSETSPAHPRPYRWRRRWPPACRWARGPSEAPESSAPASTRKAAAPCPC